MEFRLNKIDMDIRRNLAKEVKEKEVNRKYEPALDDNIKKPFVEPYAEEEKEKEKKLKKRYITVEGTIEENKKITVDGEREMDNIKEPSIGRIIDSVK